MENLNDPLLADRDEAFPGLADALRLPKEKIVFGRGSAFPGFRQVKDLKGEIMKRPQRAHSPISSFLPTEIDGFDSLAELALDLRWSWSHATDQVWRQLDPELWELTHNAVGCSANGLAGSTRTVAGRSRLSQQRGGNAASETSGGAIARLVSAGACQQFL